MSKPVRPPWNDSSKNLVRDLAGHLRRHQPVVMTRRGETSPVGRGRAVGVYRADAESRFAPSLSSRIGVLAYLLSGPPTDIWHFFFAPNRKSSTAGRFARAARRVPCIHTVCSLPPEHVAFEKLLFADVTVALSGEGYSRLAATGVGSDAIRRIPPSVPPLEQPSQSERLALRDKHRFPEEAVVWIYPADLEHGHGAEIALDALACSGRSDELLVMACRDKTPRAADIRANLVERAQKLGLTNRVRWVGETPHILELLAASDFVVLPSRTQLGKMDYPLVALEAMCMARPVLVSAVTSARELCRKGAARAVEPDAESLAAAVSSLRADGQATHELGVCARRFVLDELCPIRAAAAYETLYDEIHG